MTHLTRDELLAWRDAPADGERARIVGHLASCDECGAAYAELIRTRPADAAPARFDERAFAERGYAAARPSPPPAPWLRPRVLVPLAAAAAVILALALPARDEERPADDADAVRGSKLETIAPDGRISGPLEFRWMTPFDRVRYVLNVTDANGNPVATRETRTGRLDADAALDAILQRGVTYRWTVTAVDEAGEVIATTPPRTFTRDGR